MTSFSDDFNRVDSTDLGSNWVEVSGDWSIVGNQLSSGSAGGTVLLRAATPMSSNDNYAQATIAATASVTQGVWCRGNSNLTSGYLWRNNGTSWDLFAVVGGSFTLIATYTAAAAVNDVAKIQAVGSLIKGFVNGVERVSATDTSVTTGTTVGIRCESTNAIRWDNFSAGDVVSTVPVEVSVEIETAQTIIGGKNVVIGIATEIESAQQLVGVKPGVPGISNEQEASQSLVGVKESVLGIARETEYATTLIGTKMASVVPAIEISTALTLTSSGGGTTPMAESILNSIKKVVGLAGDDPSFDLDIMIHINSVFSDLTQLGLGPEEGFEITDETDTWDSFIENTEQNSVKSYMYLRLRLIFDPPANGFTIAAMEKQIEKLEWRLNVEREGRLWQDPTIQTV